MTNEIKAVATNDVYDVVCLADEKVTAPSSLSAEDVQKAKSHCLWVRKSECATVEDGAVVATIRGLSHRECATIGYDEVASVEATEKGVINLVGAGLPNDKEAALERLPFFWRRRLGQGILSISWGTVADPFGVTGSRS